MIFTEAHRDQLDRVGFTLVAGVIPGASATQLLNALRDVSSVDYANPPTWYSLPESYPGIIPSHHHQAQWDIRQNPSLYKVFSSLWGTQNLWVTMDRIGFVPPLQPGDDEGCTLHWDVDPSGEATYQAIVYLTDAGPERAPFHAAPEVFQQLDAWLARMPESFEFGSADFSREPTVSVPGKAGDLIVWNSKLPHGPGPNRASLPRVMQAVTMLPPSKCGWSLEEQVSWWRTKRAPPWWRDVPGQIDPEHGAPATLTEHGERLVGVRAW
jgi:hypothetical protein